MPIQKNGRDGAVDQAPFLPWSGLCHWENP